MTEEQKSVSERTEGEIDLIELGRKIWSKRKMVLRYAMVGAIAGLVIGFSIPRTYTTTVKMAPEAEASANSGSMSGLAALAGINMNAPGKDGITSEVYPDIVQSTPFLLEFADIPVTLAKKKKGEVVQMSMFEYMTEHQKRTWWSHIFKFPRKAMNWVGSWGKEESIPPLDSVRIFNLPKAYREFTEGMGDKLHVNIDKKTGMIQVDVTMQDPFVSALAADSLISKLQKYMTVYKTQKTRQDLEQSIKQSEEARVAYYEAEDLLAEAIDRNRTISSEILKVRIERLRNERNLAYNIYNQMASQVEMNRIKLQEETPIATIVEPAIIPQLPAGPKKKMIFIGLAFLGAFVATGLIVVKELLKPGSES